MQDSADEGEADRAGASDTVSNDLLDEALVFGRFSVIERRVLDDIARSQPRERLRAKESAREVEEYFIWQTVREDFVKVLRNICCCDVVHVVTMACRGGNDEWEGLDAAVGREDDREAYHRARASVVLVVVLTLDARVLGESGHDGMSRLVALDELNDGLEVLLWCGGEGRRVLEACKYTCIEEEVVVNAEVADDGALGHVSEGWVGKGQVDESDKLVDARVQQEVRGSEYCVDVSLLVLVQVNQLDAVWDERQCCVSETKRGHN